MAKFIPAGQAQPSATQRQHAAQTTASMDVGSGPYLYLAQANSKVVIERQEAKAGDYVVMNAKDHAVNLGQNPCFIVVSQHRRWVHERKGDDGRMMTVWDLAWDQMTAEQQHQTTLDWKTDPMHAKPVDNYMLLHVEITKNGEFNADPHGLQPFPWRGHGTQSYNAKKFTNDISRTGFPMFAAIWQFGHELTEGQQKTKWRTFTHSFIGTVPEDDPLYVKLYASWQKESAARNAAMQKILAAGPAATPQLTGPSDESLGHMADAEAGNATGQEYAMDQGGQYATTLPSDDEVTEPVASYGNVTVHASKSDPVRGALAEMNSDGVQVPDSTKVPYDPNISQSKPISALASQDEASVALEWAQGMLGSATPATKAKWEAMVRKLQHAHNTLPPF